MKSNLVLVTWGQLVSGWIVGKNVLLISNYDGSRGRGVEYHSGYCFEVAVDSHREHRIDVFVRDASGSIRSMDIEENLYNAPQEYTMCYIDPDCADMILQTNKGALTCWKCGCCTENRRDFSDMTIREFCPRCKI